MTPIAKRQRARFYLYTQQKHLRNVYLYIQKSRHFLKSKTICVTFLFTKRKTLYVTRFLVKYLILASIYISNHGTLCSVTFLFTKSQTLQKSKTICVTFFIYKKPDTLRYAIFMEF